MSSPLLASKQTVTEVTYARPSAELLSVALAQAWRSGAGQGFRSCRRGQDLDATSYHGGFAAVQREQVRHAIFPDDDERARFDHDCTARPADLCIGVFFIVSALARPANVTNRGAKRDTDFAQGQNLGLPGITHRTHDAVRLGHATQLAQEFAHQAFEIHARLKGITGRPPGQTRVALTSALGLKSEPMKELTLGTLRARLCGGTDREGGGTGPVVVLLHGYGAPGTDLVPLWRELAVPHEVRFVFPEAPQELGFGGRAWWNIDMTRLQDRFDESSAERLTAEVPPGSEEARNTIVNLLDALEKDHGVLPGQVIIGGFSQGAMLATDVVLRSARPFGGLAIMSGSIIARAEWLPLMPARRGLRVLQSHGRADQVLPFAVAEQLRDALTVAGLQVEFIPFNGGHAIPGSVLDGLTRLIQSAAPAKAP